MSVYNLGPLTHSPVNSPVYPAYRCSAPPDQIIVSQSVIRLVQRPRGARPSRAIILAFFAPLRDSFPQSAASHPLFAFFASLRDSFPQSGASHPSLRSLRLCEIHFLSQALPIPLCVLCVSARFISSVRRFPSLFAFFASLRDSFPQSGASHPLFAFFASLRDSFPPVSSFSRQDAEIAKGISA